jgi:putative tryptophan/tyrosine transport system substrate-binding protein
MNRRTFVAGMAAVMATPVAGETQATGKVPRVGILSLGPASTFPGLTNSFRQGMRELGYVEGTNYVLEMRDAGGKPAELPAVARALVARGVDVILVGAGITLVAVTAATRTIPIVVAAVTADPVRRGDAASLARPAGNVTGLSGVQMEGVSGKWLEFLREAVPSLSRIILVMNPTSQSALAQEIEVAAKHLGIAILPIPVTNPEDVDSGLAKLLVRRGDGLIVFSEAPLWARRARIAELVATKRLPAIYTLKAYVEAGGLMSYAPSYEDAFRRSAAYVDKILRGAKPGDLPIERPSKFELVINLKTARALNLTIPPSLLLRADQVIE